MVFYNTTPIKHILEKTGMGDSSLLPGNELEMRPDITDTTALSVFEIKPSSEMGLQDGLQKIQTYLLALNRTVTLTDRFSAGRDSRVKS